MYEHKKIGIALADPIWELQDGDDPFWFEVLTDYYLPLKVADLELAYRRWSKALTASGENSTSQRRSLDDFAKAEKFYAWRRRHKEYRLYLAAKDLDTFEKASAVQTARIAEILKLATDRAQEIMQQPTTERIVQQVDENGNPLVIVLQPRQAKDHRDAVEMLKAIQQMQENATAVGKVDRYISYLHDLGFEVITDSVDDSGDKLLKQSAYPALEPADEYDS